MAHRIELRQGFSLREVSQDDAPALLSIEKSVSPFPWSARQFADSMKNHQGYVLLCQRRVIGYLFFQQVLDQAELLNIAVKPSFQGEGLGATLLEFCVDKLHASVRCLHLEVRASNFAAIALYISRGFRQVGERRDYYHDEHGREDALLMSCDLGELVDRSAK